MAQPKERATMQGGAVIRNYPDAREMVKGAEELSEYLRSDKADGLILADRIRAVQEINRLRAQADAVIDASSATEWTGDRGGLGRATKRASKGKRWSETDR